MRQTSAGVIIRVREYARPPQLTIIVAIMVTQPNGRVNAKVVSVLSCLVFMIRILLKVFAHRFRSALRLIVLTTTVKRPVPNIRRHLETAFMDTVRHVIRQTNVIVDIVPINTRQDFQIAPSCRVSAQPVGLSTHQNGVSGTQIVTVPRARLVTQDVVQIMERALMIASQGTAATARHTAGTTTTITVRQVLL